MKLLIILLAVSTAAAQDCSCEEQDPAEAMDVFKFLATVSDEPNYPIVPGLLAPLAPCSNCLENTRKKRKIIAQEIDEVDNNEMPVKTTVRTEIQHRFKHDTNVRNKCPIGHVRLGNMCLELSRM